MTNMKQRNELKGWALAAVLFLYLGGYFLWESGKHHGSGVVQFGGEAPYGGIGTDTFSEVVSERQYRRNYYAGGVAFLCLGGLIGWGIVREFRKPDGAGDK